MCDDIDRAQDETQSFIAESLRRHARQRPHGAGRKVCIDCSEPISEVRRGFGAVRCMECEADERLRRFRNVTRGAALAMQH